jgi:hypothetical protein
LAGTTNVYIAFTVNWKSNYGLNRKSGLFEKNQYHYVWSMDFMHDQLIVAATDSAEEPLV